MVSATQIGRGVLFVLYTATCVNVVVGPIMGTYYKVKEKYAVNLDMKRNYNALSFSWYISTIPLVGPTLGIYVYSMSGMD